MNITNKQGISLIVLIVTIIVIIILAAVVILTLSKNNPIESAKEASFKEDIRTFQDELAMTVSKQYANAGGKRDKKINADKYTKDGAEDSVYTYIPSFKEKYNNRFVIENDEILYTRKVSKKEIEYLESMNIKKKGVKYITDGLILLLDGIENTRGGNNPNATIWEDLSDNENDGEFINLGNSIQYKGNGYEFTNNSDYIKTIKKLGLNSDPDVTVEVVYTWYGKQNDDNQDYCGLFWFGTSSWASSGLSFDYIIGGNNKLTFHVINKWLSSNSIETANVKKNACIIKKSGAMNTSNVLMFRNGDKIRVTGSDISNINLVDSQVEIGRGWKHGTRNRTFNGTIHAIRIYNRILSEDEIKYNYEIDKARFGL